MNPETQPEIDMTMDELFANGWTFRAYDSEGALWHHDDGRFFQRPWTDDEKV